MKRLPFDKKPVKRLRTIKSLKTEAWSRFAKKVRERGAIDGTNVCISCTKPYPISKLNAGHFIHGKWTKLTGLDERNVWPQCVNCNLGLAGNQAAYAEALKGRKEIGVEGVEALFELSKQRWNPKREELEAIILKYGGNNGHP